MLHAQQVTQLVLQCELAAHAVECHDRVRIAGIVRADFCIVGHRHATPVIVVHDHDDQVRSDEVALLLDHRATRQPVVVCIQRLARIVILIVLPASAVVDVLDELVTLCFVGKASHYDFAVCGACPYPVNLLLQVSRNGVDTSRTAIILIFRPGHYQQDRDERRRSSIRRIRRTVDHGALASGCRGIGVRLLQHSIGRKTTLVVLSDPDPSPVDRQHIEHPALGMDRANRTVSPVAQQKHAYRIVPELAGDFEDSIVDFRHDRYTCRYAHIVE